MRRNTAFEDDQGNRLYVCLEDRLRQWATFIEHRPCLGHPVRGATTLHGTDERSARIYRHVLESAVLAAGWRPRAVHTPLSAPHKMRLTADGTRLFRDAYTGEWVRDESSSRPVKLKTTLDPGEVAFQEDEFSLDNLPTPAPF